MVGWVAARPLISSTFRVTYFLQIRPGYSLFDAVPGLLRSHLRTLSSSLSFMRKVWEANHGLGRTAQAHKCYHSLTITATLRQVSRTEKEVGY